MKTYKINRFLLIIMAILISLIVGTPWQFIQAADSNIRFPGKLLYRANVRKDLGIKRAPSRIFVTIGTDTAIKTHAISSEGLFVRKPIVNYQNDKFIMLEQKMKSPSVIEWKKASMKLMNSSLQCEKKNELSLSEPLSGLLSPDGTKIVFVPYEQNPRKNKLGNSVSDIYIFELETGKTYQLTSTGHNVCPTWSPDGKKIAFYRGDETVSGQDYYPSNTKGFSLAIMDSDGNNLKEISPRGYLFSVYRSIPPQWSPAGNEILFDYKPTLTPEEEHQDKNRMYFNTPGNVYIVKTDGTDLRLLIRSDASYRWSPDGKSIAIGDGYRISIINPSGDDEKILYEGENDGGQVWSPDGKWIAFNVKGKLLIISIDTKQISDPVPELYVQTGYGNLFWLQ